MYKKIKRNNFILNCHGSVIIEFAFAVFIITLLIKVLLSVATYQSTVGKLDRISYSIAGIVRERSKLYGSDYRLTQMQVDELKRLAEKMLLNTGMKSSNLAITIETLHFLPSNPEIKDIDNQNTVSVSLGSCQPIRPLSKMINLSPYAHTGRWIPLYQVTLCLPTTGGGLAIPITSSAVAIER
ncbi:tight adherence pilus pseudopilin TadF [Yersinia bercovieri]|uniref:Tight adherance operon protein n=1 Tax=Yersinia bercovieri TaxID=634 RepID=A0A2G4U6D1_YERBE|nr:tight adherence pilus pseudopilin TadF [Yersinia bercovieri]PHZ28848.1 tight adherance operon protein [Yersinia bercovieri]QKJ06012.1 tight adherance operon protein [Yersinia bercovieri ATCC 43970]